MIRDTIILSLVFLSSLIGAIIFTDISYVVGHAISALLFCIFAWKHSKYIALFGIYETILLAWLYWLTPNTPFMKIDTELWCVLTSMALWKYWGKLPMVPLGVMCIGSLVQLFNEYLGDIHNWNLIDLIILVVALYWVYHEYRLKNAN